MNTGSEVEKIISEYPSISLEEVLGSSLMSRRDVKYVFPFRCLPELLMEILGAYRVLEVCGTRIQEYHTIYFDTPALAMYHMHHSGRVNRHKIRFRRYGATNDQFLEVKTKDARGITIKNRIRTGQPGAMVLSREEEFLSKYVPYTRGEMGQVMENTFNRITLVNPAQSERVTLDYQLWFSCPDSLQNLDLPGVSIAEIKYNGHLTGSPFYSALRRKKILPNRFSKYCIGMAMLNPGLKQNLFKERVRMIRKLNEHHCETKNS
jgi:hypothetical protein